MPSKGSACTSAEYKMCHTCIALHCIRSTGLNFECKTQVIGWNRYTSSSELFLYKEIIRLTEYSVILCAFISCEIISQMNAILILFQTEIWILCTLQFTSRLNDHSRIQRFFKRLLDLSSENLVEYIHSMWHHILFQEKVY